MVSGRETYREPMDSFHISPLDVTGSLLKMVTNTKQFRLLETSSIKLDLNFLPKREAP